MYCSRSWGLRLKARLAQIEVWAERQGLELAADCHLARLMQAAHLLQAPKYTCDDLATLSSTCYKLNSLQLRALLQRYQPTPDEPRIPHEIVDNVVRVAENIADELARSDGREVRLEEDPELALPFLLPEDGYSCDVVRGVPPGLVDFVAPLQHAGLCRLTAQPTSNGLWTVYMGPVNSTARSPSAMSNRSSGFIPPQQEPEIQIIKLHKSNNGMGLSIIAAKGAGLDRLGIYIKSVVKGGAADADGRLQAGDQLLKVDNQSLVGITQEKAAEYLVRTGPIVTLEVAKQGAIYHGLATLLSQPSPVMARVPPSHLMENSGGLPKSVSMGSFRERRVAYDGEGCEPTRPGSPTVLRLPVPLLRPPNFLSVPSNNKNCYKIATDGFSLKEDIFQEHQARLVNCDRDDASAFLNRKADIIRIPQDSCPEWFTSSLNRTSNLPKGEWVPLSQKTWKSDIYLTKSGSWEHTHITRSKSAELNLDTDEHQKSDKLTTEEREKALKELEEIVKGVSNVFLEKEVQYEEKPEETICIKREEPLIATEVILSSSTSSSGDFEYGSGRVAALAKYYTEMGSAGIIRGKKLSKNFQSEPNISDVTPKPGDIILPPSAFNSQDSNLILTTEGLKPVGFSMDRLIDIGHGVIMKEIKPKFEKSTQTKKPMLNLNRKSISVDEMEMRKNNKLVRKHYSLVELGLMDLPKSDPKPDCSVTNFCTSENIHKAYGSSRCMKRWMSVDDSSRSGWIEKIREKDKLDFGKDVLRRKSKYDAIKGRKQRRTKKLELQRSFVVSPSQLGKIIKNEMDSNWCRSLDQVLSNDSSRKL